MIRFCSLGSGSSGNATVVEATTGITTTRLLVDAGMSLREIELRLARAGLAGQRPRRRLRHPRARRSHRLRGRPGRALRPRALDEPRHLARDRRRSRRPRASGSRATASRSPSATSSCIRSPSRTTPPSRLQLRCSDGDSCVVVLTDLGSITAHMIESVDGLRRARPRVQPRRGAARRVALSAVAEGAHRRPLRTPQQRDRGGAARARRRTAAAPSRGGAPEPREQLARAGARARWPSRWGSRPEDIVVADPELGFDWLQLG